MLAGKESGKRCPDLDFKASRAGSNMEASIVATLAPSTTLSSTIRFVLCVLPSHRLPNVCFCFRSICGRCFCSSFQKSSVRSRWTASQPVPREMDTCSRQEQFSPLVDDGLAMGMDRCRGGDRYNHRRRSARQLCST